VANGRSWDGGSIDRVSTPHPAENRPQAAGLAGARSSRGLDATIKFRHSSAITVAAIIALIGGISVGSWQPVLLVLLVIPLAIAVWGWRSGTDVDANGVTVRAAIGRRRLQWSEIAGLETDADRHVVAVLANGARIVLTAVRAADLPALVKVTGQDADQVGSAPAEPAEG
jgi:hypothetical protein